jgi:hypothetical protein
VEKSEPPGLDNLLAAIAGKEEENPLQCAALRDLAGKNLGGVLAQFNGGDKIPDNLQHLLTVIAGKDSNSPQRDALLDLAGKNLGGVLGQFGTGGLFRSTKTPPGLDNLLTAIAGKSGDQRTALLDLAGKNPGGVLKLFEKNATPERLDELLGLITGDGKREALDAVIAALEKNAKTMFTSLFGGGRLTAASLFGGGKVIINTLLGNPTIADLLTIATAARGDGQNSGIG